MKKALSISLLLLFIAASVGVNITRHYCGSTVSDVSVAYTVQHCGGMDMEDMDCCHNEHDRYAVDSEYQFSLPQFDFSQFPQELPVQLLVLNEILTGQDTQISGIENSNSPPSAFPDIYTRVQSFLL